MHKLYGILMILVGLATIPLLEGDATGAVLACIFGVGLFTAKEEELE